jgi:hypothetical protein
MRDDIDGDLLQMFEKKNLELPEEPFRAELRRRIEKARIGCSRMYWLLTTLALAACAALAPFVIDGVTFVCMESINFFIRFNLTYGGSVSSLFGELARVLQITGAFIATPAGWVVAAAAALLSMAFTRRVFSIFA